MDYSQVIDRMENLGIGRVELMPSNMQYSPHDYVYIFLTDEGPQGRHFIVSDRQEHEINRLGYYVGDYASEDLVMAGATTACLTLDEVEQWIMSRISR